MKKNGFDNKEFVDENSINSNDKTEKRTDVLDNSDNVSRETILEDTDFAGKYRLFRKSGLNRRESLFNAAYLVCNNKYSESASVVKNKYKNVHEHPVSWSADKNKIHKHNIWSICMKCLSGMAGVFSVAGKMRKGIGNIFAKISQIPKSMDNSLRAIRAFARIAGIIILPAAAICFGVYAGGVIYNDVTTDYSFGIYVDGVYKGNTNDIDSVIEAKHQYERNLSERYGTPLVLNCDVSFKTQVFDEDSAYKPGDVTIYDEYVKSHTQRGYGLYIDNNLAAVCDSEIVLDRTVDDYISERRAQYVRAHSIKNKDIDKFVFSNHIMVVAADYPKKYFLSENELRALFDLPALAENQDVSLYSDEGLEYVKKEYVEGEGLNSEFSYSLNLDYTKLDRIDDTDGLNMDNSVPSSNITVDIAIARDEVLREYIPYAEEIIEDDTILEGMRRLVKPGKNGEKLIYYKATYQGSKTISREVVGEEVTKLPVNKVVRVGTKEATEEEKALLPTGVYIYPYQGKITSYYGWRILRGRNDFHQGLDICGPKGSPLVASDGGEVIEVGYESGYGNYCLIRHNEEIVTRYAHCDTIEVSEGDFVGQGFIVATMGDTGNVTGVHIHFEVIKNGQTVDPLPYMSQPELPYAWTP